MKTVLNLILCHLSTRETEQRLQFFQDLLKPANCLLAYGGPEGEFGKIAWSPKLLVRDTRLLAGPDLQRNRQSYCGVMQAVADWLDTAGTAADPEEKSRIDFINFMEFDHLPLSPDYNRLMVERLREHSADVLGYRLRRVDGTHSPLYLNHAHDPELGQLLRDLSVRSDPAVVLQTLGTGTFWRRSAFENVARVKETLPVYLEFFMPTVAHHLGYRVIGMPQEANGFVRPNPLDPRMIPEALQRADVPSLHPVKTAAQFQQVRQNFLP